MTKPNDNDVPQAVDRVMTQLSQDNTQGALKQIHDEMNKPTGGATESNKEFLTALTKRCQEQGYLPKLAVDFGQKNFKALDLNSSGSISAGELQHVLNDKRMMSSLDPFQREMAAYLLANSKEIGNVGPGYRGKTADITSSKLDTYAKEADTKYEAYRSGQKLLGQLGSQEKFNAIDTDRNGFLSEAEIDKGINFADRALAMPGLVTPEAAKNLKDQKESLEYLKSHRDQVGTAENDSFWNDATLKDIQANATKHPNPRNLEHIPTIDDKIADASASQKGKIDMSRGEHTSEVMIKYMLDHQRELDLDGNGKVSRSELNKILDTQKWRDSFSDDEKRLLQEMRSRFNDLSSASGRGSTSEISLSSLAGYVRKEEAARDEETKSAAAAKYARENFAAVDSDRNGWLSQTEITEAKDFYAKASAAGLLRDDAKQKADENLKALQYLEDKKKEISSATFSSDMTQADIEKFAKSKAGHVNDTFRPSQAEANKEPEKKPAETIAKPAEAAKPEEAAKPTQTAKPEETAKPTQTAKPEETAKPTQTAKPAETAKPTETQDPECKDGVCPVTPHKFPHLEGGKPNGDAPNKADSWLKPIELEGLDLDKPASTEPKTDRPGSDTPNSEGPKLEGPQVGDPQPEVTKPEAGKPKPLIDPSELTQETEQEERVRTEADLPAEPKESKVEESEKEKPADTRFKYTQENYADALKTAAEQNKPVVLIMATGKDKEAIQAAADASKDGKAVVVYVDRDTTDTKSPLGAYAASVLENHNKRNGTNDESMMTVFHVNKDANGKLQPESAKFANYGNPGDIAPLLSKQIDETIAQRAAAQAKPVESSPVQSRPVEQRPVTEVYRPAQPAQPIQQTCSPYNACNNSVQTYQTYYNQGRRGLFRRR
ncbi:MAG: hypothetical protein U0103_27665 [Candidatus Obscuribacterales bacterium]